MIVPMHLSIQSLSVISAAVKGLRMCFLLRIPSKAYYFISFIVLLIFLRTFYRYSQDIIRNSASTMCFDDMELTMEKQTNVVEAKHRSNKVSWSIENLSIPNGRTDVNCVTNWNVPLVWEGTFDPIVIDAIYKKTNPRVGVMIFAVGKYTGFLKGFLETGEKHFLTDFRVTYYIFTDNEKEVPAIALGKGRKITVLPVPSAKRWQEVVFGRMKWATITIDKQIRNEADYLFLMDVDSLFHNRIGAESFSRLSAVLHRGYYKNTERANFPYERHPESRAYIPVGEGDYYYTAAVLGGYLEDIYNLVRYCYEQSEEDSKNKIEAVWQEESHLNKYLLYNKPTKVLSPEYLWSDYDAVPADIKVVRISQLKKNYAEVRPNGGH
uniref:Globoside alpha-1,3-N-acetylgalactosaminyltransferase 1-like n=1 Tax=Oryzias latipes TaxID=8090 RepID=H2M2R9_ORYLA